jgi:release factor glutamine methyltransferase
MSTDAILGQNVESARREIAARFKGAGLDTPELDARILVGAALHLDHTALAIQAARIVTKDEADQIERFAQRRVMLEPVARIVGCKEFWGLDFQLSKATLVPRPDTEILVEAALEFLSAHIKSPCMRIADLGTGSGAILLALLSECPEADGIGTDISAEALTTAQKNAESLGLSGRAKFVETNYAAQLTGTFELIVSNPPYITTADIEGLATEVKKHDPHLALDGGEDGLNAYRTIGPQVPALLAPGGALIVEVGHDQAAAVAQIMQDAGLVVSGPPKADLGGIYRVVTGRKSVP